MRKAKLSKKTYLIIFVCIIFINIGLSVFLIKNVFAQTSNDSLKNQKEILVEVSEQKENPLLITILNIDNSAESFQTVNFTIQNVGKKPIRAYTLVANKIITASFMTKHFQSQEIKYSDVQQERLNIKLGEKMTFSIDYVDFSDGSSWGEDKYQTSEQLAQERAGRKSAVEFLRNILVKDGRNALNSFLEQNILDLEIPMPNSSMSEKSQGGFRAGYKSVISLIQEKKNQENNDILKKLDEIEKAIIEENKKQ